MIEIIVGHASTTTRKVEPISKLEQWWSWNSTVPSSLTLTPVIGFKLVDLGIAYKPIVIGQRP
jgi:hypothetical protein